MSYAPLFEFEAVGERWGLVHNRAGEFLVLARLEHGNWKYRSVTIETYAYERGDETLLELLKRFFQMIFDDFKKDYPDETGVVEELKNYKDKIDYALEHAIKAFDPIKGTYELDETKVPK